MNILSILLITSVLFLFFIIPTIIRRRYIRKRYIELLEKYENDRNLNNINNVYNLEDYREAKRDKAPNNIVKYSLTHDLVWSESEQDYVKTPRDTSVDDER